MQQLYFIPYVFHTVPYVQELFVSKSTFTLNLVRLMASRALSLPLESISRLGLPGERRSYINMRNLREYKERVHNVSLIVGWVKGASFRHREGMQSSILIIVR